MFAWNTDKVLSAIDAGISEVISTYNSSFTFAMREGYDIRMAYTIAMSFTIGWLLDLERSVAAEKVSVYDLIDAMAYEYSASNAYTN